VYVAHRTAEALIVLGFRQGRPVCLRVKPVRRGAVDVKRELLQALQYFAQEDPFPNHTEARTTPLYVVEEGAWGTESRAAESAETWMVQDGWTVPVQWATWATVPITSTVPTPAHPPIGALASVLAS